MLKSFILNLHFRLVSLTSSEGVDCIATQMRLLPFHNEGCDTRREELWIDVWREFMCSHNLIGLLAEALDQICIE